MGDSKIEWCDKTWGPVVGCSHASKGCDHCWAERLVATRLRHLPEYAGLARMDDGVPRWSTCTRFLPERLIEPLRWRKARMVFVCDKGDLFHESVPDETIVKVFGVMAACPQHQFLVLTKRPKRMTELFRSRFGLESFEESVAREAERYGVIWDERGSDHHLYRGVTAKDIKNRRRWRWPLPNVWIGTSCEDQAMLNLRVPWLLQCPAALHWVSLEPLLGPIDMCAISDGSWYDREGATWYDALRGSAYYGNGDHGLGGGPTIRWAVAGGESGPGARPCHTEWLRSIGGQCEQAGVPYFVKQLGSESRWKAIWGGEPIAPQPRKLRSRKGSDMSEWPPDLRVRQWPEMKQ